jgi:hypothetical protein
MLVWLRAALDEESVKSWLMWDIASAVAWADQDQRSSTEGPLNRHILLTSLVRVRLAAAGSDDELDQALGLLEGLTSSAREHGWNGILI